jgi:hypothetical protein
MYDAGTLHEGAVLRALTVRYTFFQSQFEVEGLMFFE